VRLGHKGGTRVGVETVPTPCDGAWHEVSLRSEGNRLSVCVDGGPPRTITAKQGDGGQIILRVPAGTVAFDDIEIGVPRRARTGVMSAFDRRETDWWRVGGEWVDHAGITCALASNWVSLKAPRAEGWLWYKRAVPPDVQVAFNVEENTEWFGWHSHPSHVHHPFDNICVLLATGMNAKAGYRLELNARDRSLTALHRDGTQVASRRQDARFPMRYVGGHAPYRPRRNHIALVKRGPLLRVLVNGQEVLRYTDPDPLDVTRVAVGGYRTNINFSHLQVRALSQGAE